MKGFPVDLAIFLCALAASVTVQAHTLQGFAEVFNIPEKEIGQCLQEDGLSDLDMAELERALQGHIASQYLDEYLAGFGCFVTCIMEKAGIIQNDEILIDELIELAERNNFTVDDEIVEKMSSCADEANLETDNCSMGLFFTSCFVQSLEHR